MTNNVVHLNGQFRFAEVEKVYWPVTVQVYGEEPEDDDTVEIQWLVSLLKRSDYEKLQQLERRARHLLDLARKGQDVIADTQKLAAEQLKIVSGNVHGWRGIAGEDGQPLAYSKATKAKLLENTRLFASASLALFQASAGAERKNSNAGAGG